MATRKRAALKIYELYVELEYIEPLIWRRLLVPAAITLPKLHDLLQLVLGWTNSHLHSFTFGKKSYGMADVDDFEELNMLDERKQTLEAALGESALEFLYEYDFWATEACLNIAMLAYNLMSLFRQAVLKASVLQSGSQGVQHTLKTLRYKLFAKAGYTTTQGRKDVLKRCVAMRQRQWIEGLWNRSKSFSLPVRFTPLSPVT
ncbi:Plasmid pRiA4b ORF-3-like protein [mine drainage metagenome]|uniref:Plasmid pRiA4b ORF-3-like protein n=1 Tax=mine drainage metagenome TaxID=410659 RepID=T1A9E3_9ZZZZ